LEANENPVIISDTELLQHFSASTSKTLELRATDNNIWYKFVPGRAEKCLFLQRGLLSLAALHLHHLGAPNAEDLYYRACALQNEASALFRSTEDITEENILDAFAFCTIVAVFNFYVSLHEHETPRGLGGFDPFGLLLSIRGGSKLIQGCSNTASSTGLPRDLVGQLWKEPPPPVNEQAHLAFAGLRKLDGLLQGPSGLVQAIELLRSSFLRFGLYPKGWLHIIAWPATVPDEYLKDLKSERPEAIILFLYWCAVVSNAPSAWYLDGWASTAAQTYLKILGGEWQDFLEWPLSRLEVGVSNKPTPLSV
jgi:hypothetical protein